MTWTLPYIPDADAAKEYFEKDGNFDLYCAGAEKGVGVHLLWLGNSHFISLDLYWQARKKINEILFTDWIQQGITGGYTVEQIRPLLIKNLIENQHDTVTATQETERLLNLLPKSVESVPAEPEQEKPVEAPAPAPAVMTLQGILHRATAAPPQQKFEPDPIPGADIIKDITEKEAARDTLVSAATNPIVVLNAARAPIKYETEPSAILVAPPMPQVEPNNAPGIDLYSLVVEKLQKGDETNVIKRMLI